MRKPIRTIQRHLSLSWLFLSCLLGSGVLSAREAPGLDSLEIYRSRDSLICRVSAQNLIQGKTRETLLSGLPVLLELTAELRRPGGNAARRVQQKYRLHFDIWENRFSLTGGGTIRRFAALADLQQAWRPFPLLRFPVLEETPDGPLQIEVSLMIILLSRREAQNLKEWIRNTQETEEDMPSGSRNTGFKLNLNRIISLFFSGDDISERHEVRIKSRLFRIPELPILETKPR